MDLNLNSACEVAPGIQNLNFKFTYSTFSYSGIGFKSLPKYIVLVLPKYGFNAWLTRSYLSKPSANRVKNKTRKLEGYTQKKAISLDDKCMTIWNTKEMNCVLIYHALLTKTRYFFVSLMTQSYDQANHLSSN